LRGSYIAFGIGTYNRSGNGTSSSPYTWARIRQ